MCICAWARVYVCGCCSKRVNWRIFAFIPVLSKWFVLYHLFSFVSACPPSLLCHVSWMCFSKFSMTPAVVWSTVFYFIYQLCPLDLWQGFCRSTVISFFILFFQNFHLHFIALGFQSRFSSEFISIYTFLLWAYCHWKNCLSFPHTESLFLGLRSKLPECSVVSFPPTHMWQCIFTPFAFFIFYFFVLLCSLSSNQTVLIWHSLCSVPILFNYYLTP